MKPKVAILLVAASALAAAAAVYVSRANTGAPTPNLAGHGAPSANTALGADAPMFPSLAARAQDVASITITRPDLEFTLTRSGGLWQMPFKSDFPVRPDAVRALLLGLSQLHITEALTSRPELFPKLGVQDPSPPQPPAASATDLATTVPPSTLVTLKDAKGDPMLSLIIGLPRGESADAGSAGVNAGGGGPGFYIRIPGESRAYAAEVKSGGGGGGGRLALPRDPLGWLETRFADIKLDRIRSVAITQPSSETLTISRHIQAEPLQIADLPPGRELKDPGVATALASVLTGAYFQDVTRADPPAPPASSAAPVASRPAASIELRTFDGLIVTVESEDREGRTWWRLHASIDPSIPPPAESTPTPAPGSAPAVGTLAALEQEATELNARWAPYLFAPADSRVRTVNTTMGDLLKDPPQPPPKP